MTSTMKSKKIFRRELADEFRQNIFGPHSRDLRAMLTRLRSEQPDEGNYVLICLEPFRKWALAKKSTERRAPFELVAGVEFTSAAEAEWAVFKLLWQSQTGETLS